MIEFRWKELFVPLAGDMGASGMQVGRVDKVLQYRTWTDTTQRTHWMNVPTVPSYTPDVDEERK